MSKQMNVVDIVNRINPATGAEEPVIVSLVDSGYTGNDWERYATEDEASAAFVEVVKSGVHATGSWSREVLKKYGVENPPYKAWVE